MREYHWILTLQWTIGGVQTVVTHDGRIGGYGTREAAFAEVKRVVCEQEGAPATAVTLFFLLEPNAL